MRQKRFLPEYVSEWVLIFVFVIAAIVGLLHLVSGKAVASGEEQNHTGDLSSLIEDACIIDGTPVILSFNNYGDGVGKKTIMYQHENGDILVIYIDQNIDGSFYHWATDKIADGVCLSQ